MSVIETETVNGHDVADRVEGPAGSEVADRDPSRLPIANLDAYKTWCRQVREDWDGSTQ